MVKTLDQKLTPDSIKNRTLNIIQDRAPEGINITSETDIRELGLDSLDYVELIMNLEEEFGIDISEEDANKFYKTDLREVASLRGAQPYTTKVDSLIDYLTKRLS